MLKLVISVVTEYQDCHTDNLSFSVYGGLIIYILNLAAWNEKKKTQFLT